MIFALRRVLFNRYAHSARPRSKARMMFLGSSEPSWSDLGAILGPLEAVMGTLETVLEPLGADLELLGAILGRSWRLLGGSWMPLGAILGPHGAVLEPLVAVLWVMLPQVDFQKKSRPIL